MISTAADGVHEVLGRNGQEVRESHPQVLGPERHPVEVLVDPEEARGEEAAEPQQPEGLVGRIVEPWRGLASWITGAAPWVVVDATVASLSNGYYDEL